MLFRSKIVDVLRNDIFFILFVGSQFSTISLHGLSGSKRRNLSRVRAVDLSLRSLVVVIEPEACELSPFCRMPI